MNNNIILEYTNYIKKELIRFYKIALGKQYDRKIVEPLMEQYIMIRYYNETIYRREKDLIERISKELKNAVKSMVTENNEEQVKNVFSLFGYLPYFDDCCYVESTSDLIDVFFEDENIKIEKTPEMKEELMALFRRMRKSKDNFFTVFYSKQFFLQEQRIKRNLFGLILGHDVPVSNLYSEAAIEKAFNTGTIREDKMFVQLTLASLLILNSAVSLVFSKYYVIDFASSLFSKDKKIERIFNIIDNELAKKHLILNITYEDYLDNKNKITELVKRGFPFSVVLDNKFDEDYSSLILFSHVFLYREDANYDLIIDNKELIATSLVVL